MLQYVRSRTKRGTLSLASFDPVNCWITIMPKRPLFAVCLLLATLTSTAFGAASLGYDPQADPFEQYHNAVAQAQAENKLVLIIAGGEWCRWCHALNRFVARNADVDAGLHDAFVVVKVYVGDENYNDFFFSQLPAARGAPHFWIIAPDRNVLSSQSTTAFERGKHGYDKREFMQFIDHWKQHASTARVAHAAGGQ
jgi:hypothetical protein